MHCLRPLLQSSRHCAPMLHAHCCFSPQPWNHHQLLAVHRRVQHCIALATLQGPEASCSAAGTISCAPLAEINITISLLPVLWSIAGSSHSPAAVQGKVQHYVFVASAGAYVPDGLHAGHMEGDKRKSSAGHVAVEKYLKEEGLPFTVFQPHYIYGPHTAKVRRNCMYRGL